MFDVEAQKQICEVTLQTDLDTQAKQNKILRDLAVKLNVAFARTQDLEEVLLAVLVGITSGDGLGFNRACLVKADSTSHCLMGICGLGPADQEEAFQIWNEITSNQLNIFDILESLRDGFYKSPHPSNELARKIRVSLADYNHVLVRSIKERRAMVLDKTCHEPGAHELLSLLKTDQLAVAPLVGDEKDPFGVIIADNFVSQRPITSEDLQVVELFAEFASLAVNKAKMMEALEKQVQELNELNKELEEKKHMLVQVEKQAALGQMADQLVHSIRNPVTTIGGTARYLYNKLEESTLREKAGILIHECRRLEKVLRQMEDFSVDIALSQEVVSITPLVIRSLALLRNEMEAYGIKLTTLLPEDELMVSADRLKLQEAVVNILKNSVEAMPEGGLLTVSVARKDGNVEIKIVDTGLGMARAHLHRADQPFFTTKSQSMGLGLSLAKRAIEKHGGSLILSRNKVGGTAVTITLPLFR